MQATHFHKVPSCSEIHGPSTTPPHGQEPDLPVDIYSSQSSRRASTSSRANTLSLSRTTAQASDTTASSSSSPTPSSASEKGTRAAKPPPGGEASLEGGTFAPLLTKEGYKVVRVARGRSSPRTDRRKTRADLPPPPRRGSIHGDGEWTVQMEVKGVDELRFKTTGLLARHVGPLPTAMMATNPSLRTPPLSASPKRLPGVATAPRPSVYYATLPHPTLDDRITPQTLHKLLKKDRLAAAFLMRATRGGDTPASQSTTGDSQRGSGGRVATVAHKLVPQPRARPRGNVPTSTTATNVGKSAGQATTDTAKRSAAPHTSVEIADTADDERAHTRAALRGDIRYLEPPGLTLANDALYYGEEGVAAVEDTAKTPMAQHGLSGRLVQHPPAEPCMHYPPVPQQYASAAEEKWAKTLQRLAPLQPRRPHKLHSVHKAAASASATGDVALPSQHEHTVGVAQQEDAEACRVTGALEQQQQQMLQFGFTSASRGEDVRLIERLVAMYARRQAPCAGTTPRPPLTDAALAAHSQQQQLDGGDAAVRQGEVDPLPFSALQAVLCVSKEYARVATPHSATSPCLGQVAADAATIASERQGVIRRLTHFDSTRVPEQYWVTASQNSTQDSAARGLADDGKGDARRGKARGVEGLMGGGDDVRPVNILPDAADNDAAVSARDGAESSTAIAAVSRQPNCGRAVGNPGTTVFFPSACPTSRSQVYLLAEALDKMMACRPEALRALADPDIAFRILPQGDAKGAMGASVVGQAEDATRAVKERAADGDPLLDAAVREASAAAYERYTSAARWVVDILDTGLVELVRQVSAQCVERGALLDVLRQTVVDVAQGHMRVLAYAKRRAFDEATRRQEAERAMHVAQVETQHALDRVRALEAEKALLERREADLTLKATRLDELLARVAAKRQRFELHSEDEHACLLHELESEMTHAANEALGVIYDEKVRLLANTDGADGTAAPRRGSVVEAPSAAEARKRAAQEKQAMEDLYTQSYQLLRTLNEAVAATDAACAPLYDAMVMQKVSPAANVAAARWATIARAVGAFEREKSHRQRVFQVFGEWCERYKKERRDRQQRQQDAQRGAAADGDFLLESSLDERSSLDELLNASAESFMELDPVTAAQKERHDAAQPRRGGGGGGARSAAEQQRLREEAEAKRIQYITSADLLAMGVTDCTADEVNAMLARNFDFKSYLHFHWQPQTTEHALTMVDLGHMVHDTQAILQEIVLRMQAMAQSAIMQKGCQPPLQPPAHPEDACVLCGRRDHVAEDKRKRQTTMQLIAQEVQRQMETLSEKCQKAESERQAARAQARQLRSDLDRAQEEVAGLQKQVNELMAYNASLGQTTLQLGRQRRTTMRGPGTGHLSVVAGMGGSASPHVVQDMNSTVSSSSNSMTRRRRQGGRTTPLQATRRRDRRSSQDAHARRSSTSLSHPSMSADQSASRPPLVPHSPIEHEMASGLNEGGTSTDVSEASAPEAVGGNEALVSRIDNSAFAAREM